MSVDGGDGDRISQVQRIKLIQCGIRQPGGIRLIHCQHHRLAGAFEHGCHIFVRGSHTGTDIRHQYDDSRRIYSDLCLFPHKKQNLTVSAGFNTAGIYQIETPAAPLA